jgi:mannose-6-phosphate isomerase-like protein (cupin superfamily)
MATKTIPQAQTFDLKQLELLSQGRTTDVLAKTDMVTVTGKVYAEGGENALHTHTRQDHGFLVLTGEATFYNEKDEPTVVAPYQGILLPAGAYYWFQSTGRGNLVMMRFSGQLESGPKGDDRIDLEGKPLPGDSLENKTVERITIPGQFLSDIV